MGAEPVVVMVAVIVDAQRMHKTKSDWDDVLARLSGRLERKAQEFHTRNFYSGNGPWRDIPGGERSTIIDAIFDWVEERKHKIVCAAVDKAKVKVTGENRCYRLAVDVYHGRGGSWDLVDCTDPEDYLLEQIVRARKIPKEPPAL